MGEHLSPEVYSNSNIEPKASKEFAPVTGEQLIDIFRSDRFKDMMDWAVSYVKKYTDAESGFTVLRDSNDPSVVVCSEVHEGITWGIKDSQMNDFETAQKMTKEGYCPIFIFDFHIHPDKPPIMPSYDDMISHMRLEEGGKFSEMSETPKNPIYAPAIGMIGSLQKDRIDILIYQRKSRGRDAKPCSEEDLNALEKDLDELLVKEGITQAEVLRILRTHGFKAAMVRLDKNLNLYKSDENKVKKFAYQPKIQRY